MIDLFFMTSPNVYKICIALEELGLDYRSIPVDLPGGQHLDPARMGGAINGKVPVIIDHGGAGETPVTIFESGAILQYLAEKHGALLPADFAGRMDVMQWLFWQAGGLGPFGGQCFHFRALAPVLAGDVDNEYARRRYARIFGELWSVMETRLTGRAFLAGDYSIADIACYPWIDYLAPDEGRERFPRVADWHRRLAARPAIQKAYVKARLVDMGHARNEIDTVVYTVDELRAVVTL